MASIFKKPGVQKGYWYACYRDDRGKRVHRTTKQTNKTEAMALAIAWEKAARAGRDRTLTESAARKVLSEILERCAGEKLLVHTCRSWMGEWIELKRGSIGAGTVGIYERVINGFIEHAGSRADLPLTAISVSDIRGFRDSLKQGRAPKTVNYLIRDILSAPFNRARTMGIVAVNPCAMVDPLSQGASGKRHPFTPEQIRDLITHADDDWKGMILLGCYTGLRLRDCAELRWNQVDLEASRITIVPRKSRDRDAHIVIPLHREVVSWLRKRPRGIGKAPLFPALSAIGTHGYNGLSSLFGRVMKKAGIKGSTTKAGGRSVNSLTFHSLRHTFVSSLANAGVPAELRQKLSDHADDRIHARYTHHELEKLKDAVDKLPCVGAA